MKLSNYLTSIDFDYRQTLAAIEALEPLYDLREHAAQNAYNTWQQENERFRDVSLAMALLKQRQGELEEERFKNDEEMEGRKKDH